MVPGESDENFDEVGDPVEMGPRLPFQKLPGDNPFGMRYIDFEGSEPSPLLWHIREDETSLSTAYYELRTNPLEMPVLESQFYEYNDLWARIVRARIFETRERLLITHSRGVARGDYTIIPVERALNKGFLSEGQADPRSARYYVDQFPFDGYPEIEDFDLTASQNINRNDSAAALFAYKLIREGADLIDLNQIRRDLPEVESNKTDREFYNKLLVSFRAMFDTGAQDEMERLGLFDEHGKGEILTRAAGWMAYCALELTALDKTNKQVSLNDPFPVGRRREDGEATYPSMESLPYIIKAFGIYMLGLPAYAGENQQVVEGAILAAYNKLEAFIELVNEENGNPEFRNDNPVPGEIIAVLRPLAERVGELEGDLKRFFGKTRSPIAIDEAARALGESVFGVS